MVDFFYVQTKFRRKALHLLPFLDKSLAFKNFVKFLFGRTDQNYIKLELCSLCNVRCVWCWMYYDSVKKPTGVMEYDNFKKFMDLNRDYLLRNKIQILPYFNGESLLHPQLFDIFDDISQSGLKMSDLHTNLSVNLDIERLMSYPVAKFVVNIGGITRESHQRAMVGSDFDLVVSNIKRMLAVNKDITFVKLNPTKYSIDQIKDAKKFMADLGGYTSNMLINSIGLSVPFLATEEEKKDFFDKIISQEMRSFLRFNYKVGDGNISIQPKKEYKYCTKMMDCVYYNGQVTVCAHDPLGKMNVGNAFEAPLLEIRKSPEYKRIYSMAKCKNPDFCRGCN